MTGTIDTYNVSGPEIPDVERTNEFAMRSISDRLDRLEGIRGFPRLERDTITWRDGDTRPSVGDSIVYRTANSASTTITRIEPAYPSQQIYVIVGDDNTSFDFANGNMRSVTSGTWTASKNDFLNMVYDGDTELWFCTGFDAATSVIGDAALLALSRWQFVDMTGDRTLVATDAFKFVRSLDATAQTATVPAMADSGFQIGDQVSFYQYGAGQLTIAAASGVTINTPTNLTVNEQYGTVVIVAENTDEWFIAGRMTP